MEFTTRKTEIIEYLDSHKLQEMQFFVDIETLQYNEEKGQEEPSHYKNVMYSFAFAWVDETESIIHFDILPNLYYFIEKIHKTSVKKITFIAHNTNKYDSHFFRQDLLYYYDCKIKNYQSRNATKEGNIQSIRLSDVSTQDKENGILLERRVKSKNNLELLFFKYGIRFEVIDNYVKTNCSIKTLGKKLMNLDLITADYLKTDFDYRKYNLAENVDDTNIRQYALEVYLQLSESEKTYIRNDVILLALSVLYFQKIFIGFDYSKRTFTMNILETYNKSSLTSFQLLNRINEPTFHTHIKYSDYHFNGENFYQWLKAFFNGGLNFYNDKYINKIIEESIFSMDLKSSYPHVMYGRKIPTFLYDFQDFQGKQEEVIIDTDENFFFLYRLEKEYFDTAILDKIQSITIRKMLVKYYTKNNGYININSNTIQMINEICHLNIQRVKCLSYVTYACLYFGAREEISKNYFIKEQGKSNKKLIFQSPYNIKESEEENTITYTIEEINLSKVLLNGIYGIPSLRSHFNLARFIDDTYHIIENGLQNSERNITFSIFVTSVALWNLLKPLQYLTADEIDENFLYCDTDSLFMKKKIFFKLPKSLFHHYHLGKWNIEEENIKKMIILNHKKYAYETNGKIKVKSAGIPEDSFDTDMKFEEFVNSQFRIGKEIITQSSILNNQGTISIYNRKTELKNITPYRTSTFNPFIESIIHQKLKELGEVIDKSQEDYLYIESALGNFSLSEINPPQFDMKKTLPLEFIFTKTDRIQKFLEEYTT